jgi:hypothetical protein
LLAASPALADDDEDEPSAEAAKLFEEGRELANRGKADEACDRYARSYKLERAPGTALNLAECEERAGNWKRAFDLYTRAGKIFTKKKQGSRAKFANERAASVQRLHPEVDEPDVEPTPPPTDEPPPPPKSSGGSSTRTAFKVVMISSLGVAALAGAGFLYSHFQIEDYSSSTIEPGTTFVDPIGNGRTGAVGVDDCGEGMFLGANGQPNVSLQNKFETACNAHDRQKWLAPLAVTTAIIGVGAAVYLVVTRDNGEKTVAVTPAVTEQSAGITATFAW